MDAFTRSGLTFDVTDTNASDDPARGTVVLLHGFPQTAHSWAAVSKILVGEGYRTLAPDQRGYSPGARPRGRFAYRTGELVADIEALIEQAGDGSVHLVGHDWGANVAWQLAASRPDLVQTLTTVSVPHPGAFISSMRSSDQLRRSWYMGAFQIPYAPEALITRRPDVFASMLAKTGMDQEMIDDTRRRIVDSGALTGGLNWYRAMALGGPAALRRRVTVPTTHVWGAGDTALARKGAELAGEFVDADYRLCVLEHATHWIPEQNATELADIVLDRIRSV